MRSDRNRLLESKPQQTQLPVGEERNNRLPTSRLTSRPDFTSTVVVSKDACFIPPHSEHHEQTHITLHLPTIRLQRGCLR